MNAPRRWKDSPDAPVGVRELLSAARPTRAIPEDTFARGVAKVAQRTAVPVAAATAIGLWTKIAIAGVALVAVTGSVVGVRAMAAEDAQRSLPAEAQPVAAAPKPRVVPTAEAPSPYEDVEPAPTPEPAIAPKRVRVASVQSAPNSPVPPVPEVAPAPPAPPPVADPAPRRAASTLVEELALLESAQQAVARDPSRALAGVAQHRARFPSGTLGAERDLVELEALKRLGRNDEARARADAWLAREPAGVYAQRVKTILASLE